MFVFYGTLRVGNARTKGLYVRCSTTDVFVLPPVNLGQIPLLLPLSFKALSIPLSFFPVCPCFLSFVCLFTMALYALVTQERKDSICEMFNDR